MKRAIQILFVATVVLAIPLAGCGLVQFAGGVLAGGGTVMLALLASVALAHRALPATTPAATLARTVSAQATAAAATAPTLRTVKASFSPRVPPPVVVTRAPLEVIDRAANSPLPSDFAVSELLFFEEGEQLHAILNYDSGVHRLH
jgi:hypothetical protein